MLFARINRQLMDRVAKRDDEIKHKLEVQATIDFKQMFSRIANDFSSMYASTGLLPVNKNRYSNQTKQIIARYLKKSADTFSYSIRLKDNFKYLQNSVEVKNDDEFDFDEEEIIVDVEMEDEDESRIDLIIAAMVAMMVDRVSEEQTIEVTETTDSQILSSIDEAIEEVTASGEFITQRIIANRAKEIFLERSNSRAELIATQTVGTGESEGKHIEATVINNDSRVNIGILKTWNAVLDGRTRTAHAEADLRYFNEPIPINENFVVGGEQLRFPRDPNGSPENIIRCRCQVQFVNSGD